jgi:hypothetical protein
MRSISKYLFIALALFAGITSAGIAFAAGNIDSVQKYSQFLNTDLDNNSHLDFISWNLPTSNNGATVTDTTLSGYIWGESVGWINLSPSRPLGSPGVRNSCTTGVLGGYAWGENAGWINFAPTTATGVNQPKINLTTGKITGTVWSQNYGWIQLSSPEAPAATAYDPSLGLVTTWRPSGACTPTGVNGACGTSNGQSFSSAPSTGLCTDGTPSSVVSVSGGYIWSCNGTGGGTTASCSASTASTCSGSGCVTGGSQKITITKYVVGGTASATDFTINVKNTVTGVVISKQSAGSPGVEYGIGSGNYVVYENPATGYTAQYGGDCAADGSVMVSAGVSKSCTVTNYFGILPPPLYPPTTPTTPGSPTPPGGPSNPGNPSNPGSPSNPGTPLNPSTPPPVNGGPAGNPSDGISPTNITFGTSLSNVVASDWLKWLLTGLGLLGVASSLPGVISRIGNMVLTFVFGRKKWRGCVTNIKCVWQR